MVEEDRYCIDIVTQIAAVRAALRRVEEEVLRDHVAHCVEHAITIGDKADQRRKIAGVDGCGGPGRPLVPAMIAGRTTSYWISENPRPRLRRSVMGKGIFDRHDFFGHVDALSVVSTTPPPRCFLNRKRRRFVNLLRSSRRQLRSRLERPRVRPLPPRAAFACRPSAGRCSRSRAQWWV